MIRKNTPTGFVFEQMVSTALVQGGYTIIQQNHVGFRPGGGKHFVDVVATDLKGNKLLVSLKWQQVSGTAEQKIPFEVISLAEIVLDSGGTFNKAYLVLGGDGWTLRDYYISGALSKHLIHADKVTIVTLEKFVALANRGKL